MLRFEQLRHAYPRHTDIVLLNVSCDFLALPILSGVNSQII